MFPWSVSACNRQKKPTRETNEECQQHRPIKETKQGFSGPFRTDDDSLTDILCNRTKPQLARINEVYKTKYGQTLLDQVKAETSGDYKVFLQMMIAGPAEADCDALNKAMVGLGTGFQPWLAMANHFSAAPTTGSVDSENSVES